MEPAETAFLAASTAPAASGLRERAHGSSVTKPSSAGEADGQSAQLYLSPSSVILRLTLQAAEQFRAVLEPSQGAAEAAAMTRADIGRKPATSTKVAGSVDLYA